MFDFQQYLAAVCAGTIAMIVAYHVGIEVGVMEFCKQHKISAEQCVIGGK